MLVDNFSFLLPTPRLSTHPDVESGLKVSEPRNDKNGLELTLISNMAVIIDQHPDTFYFWVCCHLISTNSSPISLLPGSPLRSKRLTLRKLDFKENHLRLINRNTFYWNKTTSPFSAWVSIGNTCIIIYIFHSGVISVK